jgi:arsenate reductase
VILWHNPRCSKSRQALALLQDAGHAPDIRLYVNDAPDALELKQVLAALGLRPIDMMRRSEAVFKDLNLSPDSDDDALITAMAAHPVLIERPILINGPRARIGRPPERVLEIV